VSRYHVRAVVVAGIGFFTDSYDIFAINLVTFTLGMVYWQGPPIKGSNMGGNYGNLPQNVTTAIKAATSGGAVVGQFGFGWLADMIGRRKMYGVELAIIILATLGQSLSAEYSRHNDRADHFLEGGYGNWNRWRLSTVCDHYF
jgi:PHS family inorganic phosphate transporter-like MFS transporter